MRKIILTGDRPSGKLHLGHYSGTLRNRLKLQEHDDKDFFIMIADMQFLNDNVEHSHVIKQNIYSLISDYIAVGIDINKVTVFIQSQVPEIAEIFSYLLNYVSLDRVKRNPTVKQEINQKRFSPPAGFVLYPISQAADIIAFNATHVPVGKDQLPMLEQTKEIIKKLNRIHKLQINIPTSIIPECDFSSALPGIDGKHKMSKSLANAIYLSDSREEITTKVMSAFTDPNHININDPGNIENNVVFTYLTVFSQASHFKKFLSKYENLNQLKQHYARGGLGDVIVKKFLVEVLDDILTPIREKKKKIENNYLYLDKILEEGTQKARLIVKKNLRYLKEGMHLNYFC